MTLDQLLTCGTPWAEQRAATAHRMLAAHLQGEITTDELTALMTDLAHSDELNHEADNMELKSLLVTAIMLSVKVI